MGILERILSQKQRELEELRSRKLPTPPVRRPISLARGAGDALRLITEIKNKSPSAGPLSTTLGVAERAARYELAGSNMLSVLCDETFFDGSWEHLALAREATNLPVLCKEFVIDERQIEAARAYGADAVLIIVRCVAAIRLPALVRASERLDLEPFVEIRNETEAAQALDAGATLIGVNARDLDTLRMDFDHAERVLGSLPPEIVRVHLSGVASEDDVSRVSASGADAALIGEVLMRQDDPRDLLERLARAAKNSPAG